MKKKRRILKKPKMATNQDVSKVFLRPTVNLSGLVRNETLEGRSYLVVPMIMAVEGVLNGSTGGLYYPAEELAKVPQVWNHKPVVVYHPEMDGQSISACDPATIEEYKVGIIMNTMFDGRALRAEAWLEQERVTQVDKRVMEAVENSLMMELSTGLFTDVEETAGEFNGTSYAGIARNYRPDHLAILPDQIGACSIADGAGFLRVNKATTGREKDLLLFLGINADISHSEIYEELRELVKSTAPNDSYVWVVDVYEDYFIYELETTNPHTTTLWKQAYKSEGDEISLEGVQSEVERVVSYVEKSPVSNQQGKETMNKAQVVDGLISNQATKWSDSDREFLMGLDEAQLSKFEPVANEEKQEVPGSGAAPAPAPEAPASNKAQTTAEYLQNMPAEIAQVVNSAMAKQASDKAADIVTIKANANNQFTDVQLAAMAPEQISLIAKMAANAQPVEILAGLETPLQANYAGQAPIAPVPNEGEVEEPMVMPTINFKDSE